MSPTCLPLLGNWSNIKRSRRQRGNKITLRTSIKRKSFYCSCIISCASASAATATPGRQPPWAIHSLGHFEFYEVVKINIKIFYVLNKYVINTTWTSPKFPPSCCCCSPFDEPRSHFSEEFN